MAYECDIGDTGDIEGWIISSRRFLALIWGLALGWVNQNYTDLVTVFYDLYWFRCMLSM